MKSTNLFAFDLDGTIVHDLAGGRRSVPRDLLETLHSLHLSHHVMIATGRRYRSTRPILEIMPELPYTVCNNGLVIFDHRGEIVHRQQMDWDDAEQTADRIRHFGEFPVFIFDGVGDCPDFVFSSEALLKSEGVKSIHSYAKEKALVLQKSEIVPDELKPHLIEVAAIAPPPKLEKLQEFTSKSLPPRIRGVLVRNVGVPRMGVLEFFEKETSKWSGVEWVRERLGAKQVIAAGDDENDMEMLTRADISLVMEHALPHVKSCGRIEIAGSDGLNQYLLNSWLAE